MRARGLVMEVGVDRKKCRSMLICTLWCKPLHPLITRLRHTFASWRVLRGGDLYGLKEVLGHADIQTTMIYAHLRPDAIREEMEKCFGNQTRPSKTSLTVDELQTLIQELRLENAQLRETIVT